MRRMGRNLSSHDSTPPEHLEGGGSDKLSRNPTDASLSNGLAALGQLVANNADGIQSPSRWHGRNAGHMRPRRPRARSEKGRLLLQTPAPRSGKAAFASDGMRLGPWGRRLIQIHRPCHSLDTSVYEPSSPTL
jgi:hypothetical protein